MAKFEVLGGDYDEGEAWIYLDGSFVFRKDKKIQKTIPYDRAREFEEASEASLVRLGLTHLLPDLRAGQLHDPATPVGQKMILYFDDGKAVLILVDEKVRKMICDRVTREHAHRLPKADSAADSSEE